MPSIGLIGSCVSRDIWTVLGLPLPDLVFFARTTIPSVVAAPIPLVVPVYQAPLSDFEVGCIVADVSKSALATLEAARPELMLFDLVDDRFDLRCIGGSVILDSQSFLASRLPVHEPYCSGRIVSALSQEAAILWQTGLDRLVERVKSGPLAECRIALHHCPWATTYLIDGEYHKFPAQTEILAGRPAVISAHNDLLRRRRDAFVRAFPQASVIEAPADVRVADAAHIWGLSPFHFVCDYYVALLQRFDAAGFALTPS